MDILGIGKVISGVLKGSDKILDEVITNDEERLLAKAKLNEIYNDLEKSSQNAVTERWKSDNNSHPLARIIRPLTLIFITLVFVIISFMDGNVGDFKLNPIYVPIWNSLLLAIYGSYFIGRTIEKRNGIKK